MVGRVYEAEDVQLQRPVALKFFPGLEEDEAAKERVRAEARALAKIDHPNVVTVHDVGECEVGPFLVMERLFGKTLDGLTLDRRRVLEVGVDLSHGLAAVHAVGVLHLDIKPANVMVTEDGRVKLLDFSLAISRFDQAPPTAHEIVGTPGYRAPESWCGHVSKQADVYAFGAVLFKLCAGRTPFEDVALLRLSQTVQERDAPKLTQFVPDVHAGLAKIVERCLARNPAERYPSAKDLHDALKELQRVLAAEPTRSPERSAPSTMAFRKVESTLVSVISNQNPRDDEWDEYVRFCEAAMSESDTTVLVVTAGGHPNQDWLARIKELVGERTVPTAVVTRAPELQNVVEVLSWTNPAIRTFTDLNEALEYLGMRGPAADRILSVVQELRRQVA